MNLSPEKPQEGTLNLKLIIEAKHLSSKLVCLLLELSETLNLDELTLIQLEQPFDRSRTLADEIDTIFQSEILERSRQIDFYPNSNPEQ